MKHPKLLFVKENDTSLFDIRYEKAKFFENPWHYHAELELTLITKSTGMRFVGDNVERFESGDLVLLGSNLPHYWRNDPSYYQSDTNEFAEAIILRFKKDFLGKDSMNKPEFQAFELLFDRALQGILFGKKLASNLQKPLMKLSSSKGIERLIIFLEIFKQLSQTKDFRVLSSKIFANSKQQNESDRINQVLRYIHLHLKEPIKLENVAELANMNKTAFCRYVKSQTNKTFVELLNDIRIANACRILLETKKDIAEICYECGFGNITHFNYTFKKLTGLNPTQYRIKSF